MRFLPMILLLAALPAGAQTEPAVRQAPVLTEAGVKSLMQEAERLSLAAKDPAAP